MSLFSKKPTKRLELVFDIESDSVCAAIVLYEASKAPRIVYHAESEVARKSHTDGAYLSRNMWKALESVASNAQAAMPALMEKKLIFFFLQETLFFRAKSPITFWRPK